jgi:hypothetical protein
LDIETALGDGGKHAINAGRGLDGEDAIIDLLSGKRVMEGRACPDGGPVAAGMLNGDAGSVEDVLKEGIGEVDEDGGGVSLRGLISHRGDLRRMRSSSGSWGSSSSCGKKGAGIRQEVAGR